MAWALAGTVLALGFLLLDVRASGHGILRPIRAGSRGPGAALIARDFPHDVAPDEVGLDGQQFYAIARNPLHPAAVAPDLDRPQYRYQRPLYPALAWLLHPSGGGPGLIVAFAAVSLAGLFVGALAMGSLAEILRGPPWLALLYPLLPGSVWALTSSVADGLAVSLCLVTVVATLRGRPVVGWVAAIAAALTKETTILVPLALVLARRRKEDVPLVALPVLALATWMVVVLLWVPAGGLPSEHLVLPLTGLLDAVRTRWLHGRELIGMASTVAAFVLGGAVLIRRRGPVALRWVIAMQMAFLTVCSGAVLGDDFGGTRSTLMLLAVATAVLVGRPAAAPALD
ncbi:MAG: hypothetical protein M3063_06380 [Actinomycetota bacterium]|nr:hypothetical protein [Actinomycetota bacterium]